MNDFLLDLWHDLRSTKLWPVAAGLLLALVAVPLFVLQPSPTTGEEPVVSAPGGGSAAQAALVSLQQPGSSRPSPLGAFASRDPFATPGGAPSKKKGSGASTALPGSAATAASATSGSSLADVPPLYPPGAPGTPGAAAGSTGTSSSLGGSSSGGGSTPSGGSSSGGGSSTSGGSGSSGGSSSGGGVPTAPAPGTVNRTRTTFTYVADVKLGPTDLERTLKDIEAPKLLPTDTNPLIVFLGATTDGKSALFMIDGSKLTSIGGGGDCKPDPETCSFLTLGTEGKDALHLFADNDGARYSLRLLDLHKKTLDRSSTSQTTSSSVTDARSGEQGSSREREPFKFPSFNRLFSR